MSAVKETRSTMKSASRKALSFQRSLLQPLALIACLLVYGLLLCLLWLPQLLDHEPIRRELTRKTSQLLGTPLKTSGLQLTLFPRPFLHIHTLQVPVSETLTVQVESLQVFLSWKDLLVGKTGIKELEIGSPQIDIHLGDRRQVPLPDISLLQSVLQKLSSIEKTSMHDGKLRIQSRTATLLACSALQGETRGGALLTMRMQGRSEQAEHVSLQLSGDPEKLDFQGDVRIEQLKTRSVAQFFPPEYRRLGTSRVTFSADVTLGSGHVLESSFQANAPDWKLQGRNHTLQVREPALQGRLQLGPERARLVISRLHLKKPAIELSGNCDWHFASKSIDCRLQTSDFQIAAVKAAFLSVGESEVLRKILEIVPSGRVPELAMHTRGRSPAEWLDNFELRGALRDGVVHVPEPELHLTDVSGTVRYEKGILHCRQAMARMDNAQGRNGTFDLGLNVQTEPFLLQTDIKGSFEALPAVLRKTIHSERFLHELKRFRDISGQGTGDLRIEKKDGDWTGQAGLKQGFLQTRIARPPFPLRLTAGRLHWSRSASKLGLKELKPGTSTCQSISAVFQAGPHHQFDIAASEALLDLEQFLPWLRSSAGFPNLPTKWNPAGGTLPEVQPAPAGQILVRTAHLQGRGLQPENWEYHVKGSVQGLRLLTTSLPKPLLVKSGGFQAKTGEPPLALTDWNLECLDGSVGLSVLLDTTEDAAPPAELIFSRGRLGPEILNVLHTHLPLPQDIELKGPLEIKQGSLQLRKGRIFKLQFSLEASETALDMNIRLPEDQQARYHFEVVDRFSKARIEIEQTDKNVFETSFSGYLEQGSLRNICKAQTYFLGSALGHFFLQFQLNPFHISSALGKIQISDAFLPLPGTEQRLGIETLKIKADPKQLRIQKGQMLWGTSTVHLSGTIDTASQYNKVDLHCKAETIAWEGIRSAFLAKKTKESTQNAGIADRFRKIRGTLRISAESFRFNRFAWQPFQVRLHFEKNRITLSSEPDSSLCAIRTPGTLSIEDGTFRLTVRPEIAGWDLDRILSCLHIKDQHLTGRCSLEGTLQSRGSDWEGLKNGFQGSLHLSAENGRIDKATILSKVLQLLNSTEILFGSIPDLDQDGFAYHTLSMDCTLEDSIFTINAGVLNGPSMAIDFIGRFDPRSTELELLIAVAPLKTVDRILAKIPVIKELTGKHLVSVPLKISGTLDNHRITPVAPHRLGQNFLDLLKKTLKTPVTIIQPLLENNQEIRELKEESDGR
ncbi:MAG: AsmA-like C-terminal region-containing protein [Desulfohalobiaceae bacterium]|nr:AsmA-like C-terminal region-containing protein [Desulfohalobiaceae bacterium]